VTEAGFITRARESWSAMAAGYAAAPNAEVSDNRLDRAMLDTFAAAVRVGGGGKVVEVGCGPGNVSAYLHERGLDVSGIDLASTSRWGRCSRSTRPTVRSPG
jgi:2-polyprenyl-3-methyl-5-hydroxy-6-metoxy-1,4-benzoquinol methylase